MKIGRSLSLLIASTTRLAECTALVLTPIRTVGLQASQSFIARSCEGAALWRNTSALPKVAQMNPAPFDVDWNAAARLILGQPFGCMAGPSLGRCLFPAEPAPRTGIRWSINGASMICNASLVQASATLAVPWMSSCSRELVVGTGVQQSDRIGGLPVFKWMQQSGKTAAPLGRILDSSSSSYRTGASHASQDRADRPRSTSWWCRYRSAPAGHSGGTAAHAV